MKIGSRTFLFVFALMFATGSIYPTVFRIRPQREVVREAAVVVLASVIEIRGDASAQIAHFSIIEVLKGELKDKYMEMPFQERNDGTNKIVVKYDLGAQYLFFLPKEPNTYIPNYLKIEDKTTIDNMRRFVVIAETSDKDKWRDLYWEIFQSGEFRFFIEAFNELLKLDYDKTSLEKGVLNQWKQLSNQEYNREYLIKPIIALKSKAAIPYLTDWARHGVHQTFRMDAMKALIDLRAERLKELFKEISETDPDPMVRKTAFENLAKVSN
jgi:hypothetical protein